jgi:hypothetical protein
MDGMKFILIGWDSFFLEKKSWIFSRNFPATSYRGGHFFAPYQIIHRFMHRDFAAGVRSCARRWISGLPGVEKSAEFSCPTVYFPPSSGTEVNGEKGERS